MRTPVECGGHRPAHVAFQHAVDFLHDLCNEPAGGFLGFFRYMVLEHQQGGGEIQVRLEIVKQLWLEQQLL